MSNLKTIKLYGELGRKFGKEFHFQVCSPAAALRLLSANFPDFAKFFIGEGEKRYYISLNEESLPLEHLDYPCSSKEVIRIVPVIEGASNNPGLNILIGGAILLLAPQIAPTFFAAGSTALAVASNIGWALVVGGVSAVLFTPPDPDSPNESDENDPSYTFDGPVNTVRQGNPVPIGYGRLRVGSQVVSLGIYTDEVILSHSARVQHNPGLFGGPGAHG